MTHSDHQLVTCMICNHEIEFNCSNSFRPVFCTLSNIFSLFRRERYSRLAFTTRYPPNERRFGIMWIELAESFLNSEKFIGESPPLVTFTLTVLNVVLIISSLLYIFCCILAVRKLSALRKFPAEALAVINVIKSSYVH